MKANKKFWIIFSTFVMVCCLIIIGPMDRFVQGVSCDEIACDQIPAEDYLDEINLTERDYDVVFTPMQKHLVGFRIFLNCLNAAETEGYGYIRATVYDESGRTIDDIGMKLTNVSISGFNWYEFRTNADFEKGKHYTIHLTFEGNEDICPYLLEVKSDYMPKETTSGSILLSYVYKQSVFTISNKVIISAFFICGWLLVLARLTKKEKRKKLCLAASFLLVCSAMTWNYLYKTIDSNQFDNGEIFAGFQEDSETLVTGMMMADEATYRVGFEQEYGLGRYYDLKGQMLNYDKAYKTEDGWNEGYSLQQPEIIVDSNIYSKSVAVPGNSIRFRNGEIFRIADVYDDDADIIILLDADHILNPAKNGSLDEVRFIGTDGKELPNGLLEAYKSQYGLHGKIFAYLTNYMDKENTREILYLICCYAVSIVFVTIAILIAKMYNKVLAGCFLLVFILSPWVVSFAKNLYWVEFTWFVPMAVGVLCAWKIHTPMIRRICYAATFVSILIKSLCGYEYITVVMMSLISFLLVELIKALAEKDRKEVGLYFKTTLFTGIFALGGFFAAIILHAFLRGNGNVVVGVRNIIELDALRRTYGVNVNNSYLTTNREVYALTASAWETVCQYFHFYTQVITGVNGDLFVVLCILPLIIFVADYKNKELNIRALAMYFVCFLTTISWFVLAKSHSYVHIHMNYVLWYFGYIQICIYVIFEKLLRLFGRPIMKS